LQGVDDRESSNKVVQEDKMKDYSPAIPLPVLPPSDEEKRAIAELMPRLSTGGAEARAAKLKADATLMFDKKIEPTVIPEFIRRSIEQSKQRLDAEIDQMTKKPEGE
jgi:hypothetical protein